MLKINSVNNVVKMAIGEKCPGFARVGAFGLRSPHAEPKSGCPCFPNFCEGGRWNFEHSVRGRGLFSKSAIFVGTVSCRDPSSPLSLRC